jgi:hypothetical protein
MAIDHGDMACEESVEKKIHNLRNGLKEPRVMTYRLRIMFEGKMRHCEQ